MKRLRILIVDDEPSHRLLARMTLEREGHTVVTADNGMDALEEIAARGSHYFGLILTDRRMPVMDGEEFIAKLNELYPHTPIIWHSGDNDPAEFAAVAASLKVKHTLHKPYSREQLLVMLEQIFPPEI